MRQKGNSWRKTQRKNIFFISQSLKQIRTLNPLTLKNKKSCMRSEGKNDKLNLNEKCRFSKNYKVQNCTRVRKKYSIHPMYVSHRSLKPIKAKLSASYFCWHNIIEKVEILHNFKHRQKMKCLKFASTKLIRHSQNQQNESGILYQ